MANFYNLLFLNVFLIVMLAGCAGRPVLPESPDTFLLRGKVAVREGDARFSANLLWHQRRDGFDMDLWGPMGQGRVHIVKQGDRIRLSSSDGRVSEGDPDDVMRAHLGWSLPLATLPAWVQGRPLSGVAVADLVRDPDGRIEHFRQLGWTVVLDGYRHVGEDAPPLPTRITVSRDDVRIRVVVARWRLGHGTGAAPQTRSKGTLPGTGGSAMNLP